MDILTTRRFGFLTVVFLLFTGQAARPANLVVDKALHHLGNPGEPEWEEFAHNRAEGQSLEWRFRGFDNLREARLLLRQRDVKLDWFVSLNDRPIGRLYLMEADLEHVLTLPPHSLRDGENILKIGPPPGQDDIIVGEIEIDPRPIDDLRNDAALEIHVVDSDTRHEIPCRVTVTDERGVLAALPQLPGHSSRCGPVSPTPPTGVFRSMSNRAAIPSSPRADSSTAWHQEP